MLEPSPSLDDLEPADRIGRRLAELRARRGWPVSELARRAGVSASLVSQIERGRARPSVRTLVALARAVEVGVDALFATNAGVPRAPDGATPSHRYVVRSRRRPTIEVEGGERWERLTPTVLQHADVMERVYEPQATSRTMSYGHRGLEMILLLGGRLVIDVDGERYELEAGDSLCLPSTSRHSVTNPDDTEARAVIAHVHERAPAASSSSLPPYERLS